LDAEWDKGVDGGDGGFAISPRFGLGRVEFDGK
jgi:hypothetical protein